MAQTYTFCLTHIVFSTKDRQALITPGDMQTRLHDYLVGIAREADLGFVAALNSMPDHVHILVNLAPKWSLADAVGKLKANSTRWINTDFPGTTKFSWQGGYSGFSVSASNQDAVTAYIRNQQKHHEHVDFVTEFRALLEKHGIDYDERYLL